MLDIRFIRENPEKVKENIKKKFQDDKIPMVDKLLKADEEYRAAQREQKINELEVKKLNASKTGSGLKPSAGERKTYNEARRLKSVVTDLEDTRNIRMHPKI